MKQTIRNEILNAFKSFKGLKSDGLNIGDVSDFEVETFILTNPYFDETLMLQLIDKDFAGFHPNAKIYGYWKKGFVEQVRSG